MEGGRATPLPVGHWDIRDLTPLPGGLDLVVAGNQKEPRLFQLFSISMHGGESRQITNDVSTYMGVRASADGRTLLALQRQIQSTVQVVTPAKEAAVRVLSGDKANRDGRFGLACTLDGKIVFASAANGREEVWKMNADGSARERPPLM
jgi:Tol biopolymer transport system component